MHLKKRLIKIIHFNKITLIIIISIILLFTLAASASEDPNWSDLREKSYKKIEQAPNNIQANYDYLISLVNLGEIKSAYNTIDKFEDNFDEKKFAKKITPYFQELVKCPKNILILNYTAFYGVVVKDYELSIKYFDRILDLTPENYNIRNFLAASYIELEKYDLALREANRALVTKDNEFSHLLLGVIYYENGNFLKAISEFSKSGSLGREILNNN